jgi:chromosomal replication initiator protein
LISGLFSLPLMPSDAVDTAPAARARNDHYRHAAFVAGPENMLVRLVAQVVESRELAYNPIVLLGAAGVGKSSLAHALTARRREKLGLASVIAITGDELAGALADAIEADAMSDFRTRYHRCDLLLIDDVRRLADKPAAQQFLMTAIDTLVRRGSLVLATLRSPASSDAMDELSPALASRLSGGLVVRLAPPGPLARQELVRQFASQAGLALREADVARLVGEGLSSRFVTAPALRHAVFQLAAAKQCGSPGRTQFARINDDKAAGPSAVCRRIVAVVAKHFGLTAADLKGKSRTRTVAEARGLAMYVTRRLTAASYAQIGRQFGGRDHTTVLHACQKVTRLVAKEPDALRLADELVALAMEGAA